MKKIGKIKAIIISSVIALVMVLGLALSFIPVSIGSKDYESFAGALAQNTTISDGMSVEYKIKSDSTDKEIKDSIKVLTNIISEYGIKSVNAYRKGTDTIRVDLGEPVLISDRSATEDFLSSLSSGRMQFKNKNDAAATLTPAEGQTVDESLIIIEVSEHVEKISKINSRGASGIQIDFNKAGRDLFSKATGSPLYMFVDGEAWPSANGGNEISANNDPAASSMYLMFNSSDVVDSYYYVLLAGQMTIELDAEKVEIFYTSTSAATVFKVAGLVVTAFILVGLMVLLALKQKGFAIAPIVSSIIGLSVLLLLLQAMDWVVFGLTSILAIAVVGIIIYAINSIIYNGIKSELALGKSLSTASADAFKRHTPFVVDTLVVTLIFGFVLAIFSSGELVGVGTILALSSVIIMLNTLLFNRLILNCIYSMTEKTREFLGFGHEPKEEN